VHRGQGGFTRRDTLEDVLDRAYPPSPNASPGEQSYYFVHRLDMETTGCLLIAKSDAARDKMILDFSERKIHKEYLALAVGEVDWKTKIVRAPIRYIKASEPEPYYAKKGRNKRGPAPPLRGQKKGIALEEGNLEGKTCETRFDVLRRYKGYTLFRVIPRTGRTHQIRVHLQSVGHTLAYDPLYGRKTPLRFREFDLPTGESDQGEEIVLNRLPLHAWKLRFNHPQTGSEIAFEAPLPRDLKDLFQLLKKYRTE